MYDGYVIIGTKLDTSGFEDGVEGMEQKSKLQQVIESIQDKFSSMFNKTKSFFKDFGKNLNSIGKKIIQIGSIALKTMTKILVSAAGFGLAFIGALGAIGLIISGLMIIVGAFKKFAEENKQVKTDLQYIVFAIKTALEPAMEWLAQKIKAFAEGLVKILTYAMAIANTLAGRNLFEKADAKAFAEYLKKSEKSSGKTANNAAKIRKQLTGIDEMNVLQDNVSGGASAQQDDLSNVLTNLPEIQKQVDETVAKYRLMWKTIGEINRSDAKKAFLGNNDPWGLLKLGAFDIVSGLIKMFDGLGGTIGSVGGILIGLVTRDMPLVETSFRNLIDNIKTYFTGLKQFIKGVFEVLGSPIYAFIATAKNYFKDLWKDAKEKIQGIKKQLQENFSGGLWKGIVNTFIDILNSGIKKINSKFSFTISDKTAKVLGALGIKVEKGKHQIITIPTIPKLANGGVINLPGRGVALGGEVGKEGVIPLTDSQQMELLGEAIGRYITINANITNRMNGRVLSREIQKIQNQTGFASNWR